jgi:hypothetical protein
MDGFYKSVKLSDSSKIISARYEVIKYRDNSLHCRGPPSICFEIKKSKINRGFLL